VGIITAQISGNAQIELGGAMRSVAVGTRAAERRRLDLDLTRAVVVACLVFFHAAYTLNSANPMLMRSAFLAKLFAMPLMFVVAGAGIWFSLRSRVARAFVTERLRRLLVPLVVGIVLVVPPQVYYSLRSNGEDPGPYWQFLGRFFGSGLFESAHLWFLWYLLLYSVALLPLFLWLRLESGRPTLDRMALLSTRPGGLFLLGAPVAVVEAAFGSAGAGGWNVLAYVSFLVLGFLISAEPRIRDAVLAAWWQAVLVGIAALAALFVIVHWDIGGADQQLGTGYTFWAIVWRLLKGIAGWAWTLAVFGLGNYLAGLASRRLRTPAADDGRPGTARLGWVDRAARYANQAVLPFYVLHQTPIVIIGFYVVQCDLNLFAKYLIISLSSLAVTLLIYDLAIRRANVTRVMFGMPRR
jgi:glucan biosynthesis protein C